MLLGASGYALYLAIVTSFSYADGQNEPVPVIGMTTGIDEVTGERPSRMNVNIMAKENGPMWYGILFRLPKSPAKFLTRSRDLFIRALDALQNQPEEDERSHFAMAGIHGMPYAPYNGVGPVPGYSWGGFCPHQSPQLISWHRAYLALYEQVLGNEVQRLALEYTHDEASAYRDASQKFRLPYWDWALDPTLPPSTTQENIKVNGPNGELVLHNPLYNYRWQTYPLNSTQFPGQDNVGSSTTRAGNNGFDPDLVNGALSNATDMIKDSVYRTFSAAASYDEMASMAGSGTSFESPHNMIHDFVGGTFVALDLTAFDSLFMLHHCNLDRLAAIWTSIHSNDLIQTQPFNSQGLYSTAKGEPITADSPLKPFYQADGKSFHTGKTVATTEVFGYTYPDISGPNQGRRGKTIAKVNKMYGDLAVSSTSMRGWFVSIQVDRVDLPLPCSIDVYLGDHIAGRSVLLSMPATGPTYNELSLNRAIKGLGIDENDDETIESTLKRDLCVRVTKVGTEQASLRSMKLGGDSTTLDPKDIRSLSIKVMSELVTMPGSEDEFPLYSNRTMLRTILGTPGRRWTA
ncbi:Di-copper centre-containing protein [Xylaria nigripes]|nr:Di-copper centre-containing protein [Xylaria nigripes]